MVLTTEAPREPVAEVVEGVTEDRRPPVAVGEEEADGPVRLVQGGLAMENIGVTPLPPGEGDDVAVALGEDELPAGGHLQDVAGGDRVVEPVGDHATGDPLDGDLQVRIDRGADDIE